MEKYLCSEKITNIARDVLFIIDVRTTVHISLICIYMIIRNNDILILFFLNRLLYNNISDTIHSDYNLITRSPKKKI